MSKVLVTGSAGFIGKHLISHLKTNKYKVIELSHSDGDISSPDLFKNLPKVSYVIHLAGRHFVPDSWKEPREFLRVNLLGTQNVIDFCLKHDCKLIFSSAYLYGIPVSNPISENHEIIPNNPYGLNKYFSEQLLEFYSKNKGLKAIALRLFNVYGPNQKKDYLIPSIFDQIEAGKDIKVNNFFPRRDYIYILDVIKSFLLAMDYSSNFDIFNIGSGTSHSVEELLKKIKKITKTNANIISREIYRENEVMDAVADIRAAKKKLGWQPQYTLDDGLREIWSQRNRS